MYSDKVIGHVTDSQFKYKEIDYLELDWHQSHNKILRQNTNGGRDVALRFDDEILKSGLKDGDVIGITKDDVLIVISIKSVDCLVVNANQNMESLIKASYEIGNCHAPLFGGDTYWQLVTIYNEPMEALLKNIPNVTLEHKIVKLNFDKKISSIIGHSHHHSH